MAPTYGRRRHQNWRDQWEWAQSGRSARYHDTALPLEDYMHRLEAEYDALLQRLWELEEELERLRQQAREGRAPVQVG